MSRRCRPDTANMNKNVTRQLIEAHLVDGKMTPGEEIGLRVDQTLTQDATGTMVMLEFEAMQVPRAKTEVSARNAVVAVEHGLSARQVAAVLEDGLINVVRKRQASPPER